MASEKEQSKTGRATKRAQKGKPVGSYWLTMRQAETERLTVLVAGQQNNALNQSRESFAYFISVT